MESNAEKSDNYSIHTTCIKLEHDYCVNPFAPDDNNKNNYSEKNVFKKKFHSEFGTVDKWADSVILRLPASDDWKKNVDREITILKVKCPFLPEQQIRGKVYKKFGIPAVMGGALSRGINLIGGSSPRERAKTRRRDAKKKGSKKILRISEIFNDDTQAEEETIFSNESTTSTSTYEDKSGSIENSEDSNSISIDSDLTQSGSTLIMDELSIECETTQSLTADFQLENARRVASPVTFGKISQNPDLCRSLTKKLQLSNSGLVINESCSGAVTLTPKLPNSNNPPVSNTSLPDTVSIDSQFDESRTASDNEDLRANPSINSNVTFMSCFQSSEIGQKISIHDLRTLKNSSFMNKKNLLVPSSRKNYLSKDQNENLMTNVPSGTNQRGRKRMCDRELQSMNWSPLLTSQAINDTGSTTQLFKTNEDTPYKEIQTENSLKERTSISIGTKLPTPELLKRNTSSPDIVILDHPYCGKIKKPYLITIESDDSDNEDHNSTDSINKTKAKIASKKLSGKNVTINNPENERSIRKINNCKEKEKKIENCEAEIAHFDNKENRSVKKRVCRTKPETKIFPNNHNEILRFHDNVILTAKKLCRLFSEGDNESIQSVEITSPAVKKRRVCHRNRESTSQDVKIIKAKFASIPAHQTRQEINTPKIIVRRTQSRQENDTPEMTLPSAKKGRVRCCNRQSMSLDVNINDEFASIPAQHGQINTPEFIVKRTQSRQENGPEITSPAAKKRRVCYRSRESISPNVKIIKEKFASIPAQFSQKNDSPEIIDISDDIKNATILKAPVTFISDPMMILDAKFIPCRGNLPLFIIVDPLSNHCCEYDQDFLKIMRLTEYANNFDHDIGTNLRDSLNVSWSELKEKIESITEFLENNCRE